MASSSEGNSNPGTVSELQQQSPVFAISTNKMVPSDDVQGFAKVDSAMVNNTILIIPVNGGWHDLGFNLWCSLQKVTAGKRPNMLFLAFDSEAYEVLRHRQLPVYMDPGIALQASAGKEWGSKAFNSIVCSKLSGVLHLLERGLNVFLVDADVAFQTDPFLWIPEEYDITWSWGGHLNPQASPKANSKQPPACGQDFTPGRCYVNTGFYYAKPTQQSIQFIKRAEKECFSGRPTLLGDRDDQTYVNELLKADEENPPHRMACFDPCRWTNGNTFFKYHIPQKMGQKAVSVHANFMTGSEKKRKKFQDNGLWDLSCIPNL
eukprot:GGOE01036684.1.p1 GENE.GGOE01036684.1~~GGOE01036684.1.p1  ORF type:complete len:375 (+),score=86.72 GGOE01036684.1:170-1126(+)